MMTVTTVTGETDETLGTEVAVMVEGITEDKMMTGEVNLTKVYLLVLELTEVMAKHLPLVLLDRKSTRLNSSHSGESRMPSSA